MRIVDVRGFVVTEMRPFLMLVTQTYEGITGVGEAGLTGQERAVLGPSRSSGTSWSAPTSSGPSTCGNG